MIRMCVALVPPDPMREELPDFLRLRAEYP